VEAAGDSVRLAPGSVENPQDHHPLDLVVAEAMLARRNGR
jgi:hypothetical protein